MAHDVKQRPKLRAAYVGARLAMDVACLKCKLPKATGVRWKREAKAAGDDWDAARAAMSLSDDAFADTAKTLLNDYLLAHQATMVMLREAKDLSPLERADAIASLSDSFNKTMSSFRKLMPETDRLAVALDVMQRLARFVSEKYPTHATALLSVLEPFGEELSRTLK